MIEIIQNIIDLLTQTPTLYVDGVVCEVHSAWVGAALSAIFSIAGAGMSANASASAAKKQKRAAQKNYNMLMENAEMSKLTLGEQMDMYEKDMDSYRSSMIQRYGLAGGLREETAGLREIQNYKFDTKEIDTGVDLEKEYADEKNKFLDDKVAAWKKERDEYNNMSSLEKRQYENQHIRIERNYDDNDKDKYINTSDALKFADERALREYYSNEYDKKYDNADERAKLAKKKTDELGEALRNYEGKQTNWMTKAKDSAILNLQTSVTNMQRDINNAYKAGMIDYWQQRKNAQNVLDTGAFQAAQYSTQAQTTLANGFLSAIQYGAQAYSQYKSGR